MKEIKKISLSNVISKLSRNQMRYVMAGSGGMNCKTGGCSVYDSNSGQTYSGTCQGTTGNNSTSCYCLTALGSYDVGNSSGMSSCTR